jgi:hypothetical protein
MLRRRNKGLYQAVTQMTALMVTNILEIPEKREQNMSHRSRIQ